MSTKIITYIALISIALVLVTQALLVVDYFQTVRESLIRESDAILLEAFRNDLNRRNEISNALNVDEDESNVVEGEGNEYIDFNLQNSGLQDQSILGNMDLLVHSLISRFVPINLTSIDSITGPILASRNINSEYTIQLIQPEEDVVVQSSKDISENTFFLIPSKPYPLDFENKDALRLILVNPFSLIIRRMGLMVLGSIIFSFLSIFAFRSLIRILARQKKLVAFKNEFLSNIAHELKRPVASLIVNLDVLKEPMYFDNEQMRDMMLNNSLNSLTELNGTISMIVGLAKVEEGLLVLNKQPVNLVKLLDELRLRFIGSPKKKLTINTDFESDEMIITADGLMLTQCFANLIDNSIKYSKSEVVIDISMHWRSTSVELHFKDNGIGIPPEKIGNIFEKYSRVDNNTKVNGFGIGLNYVKTIIEKHSGSIAVTSELGEGSDFKVVLPKK